MTGEKSEEFLDVAINAQGRLYLAGYQNGEVGVESIDPSGDSSGVLWKVTPADPPAPHPFQFHEEKTLDLPGTTETIDALTFHPVTGALYFAGRTTGAFNRSNGASADFTHQGQQDVFVAGPQGSERDVVLYQGGSVRPQHPNQLAFDARGNLIVSGFDDIYIPTGTKYVERWEDPFITRLARSEDELTLEEVWTKSFDTPYTDVLGGLAVDPNPQGDLGIYVTGNSGGGAQRGAFVRKIDNATGDLQPVWIQSPISMDIIQSAHFLEDGNLLIVGTTFGVMGEQSHGEQDVVLRLLNMNPALGDVGSALWTKQYGSPGSEFVTDVALDAEDNIIVVGETLGSVLENESNANKGSYDIFMMRFDKNGERTDVKQWGSPAEDHPNAVAVDTGGQIFIVGYTMGSLVEGCTHGGGRDAFFISTTASSNGGTPRPSWTARGAGPR